ncbi:hypothetical protein RF11_06200 [Thelohanellus kitauei]|uniref:Uncharacterized protein n=1 Tax=Thelohanellus kitauei TaxID=669202 RepID=A0A0C2MH68_THEKT|nr:hypothetical protein RF11_06200 [Thelohanellus kitauei]
MNLREWRSCNNLMNNHFVQDLKNQSILSVLSIGYSPQKIFADLKKEEYLKFRNTKNTLGYIDGGINPADIASRGASVQEIVNNHNWWNGPEWIKTGLITN